MTALTTETENINYFIGKIPVHNLWLLMLYASDLHSYIKSAKKFNKEENENLNEIANLVAQILCHQVKKRLIRKLNYSYETKTSIMRRVRGRIDILTTESRRLLGKGKVCCTYDELTINTPRNRYVHCALEHLTKFNIKPKLSKECKTLSVRMQQLGISNIKPANYNSKLEKFGRHDSDDKEMVAVADFAFLLHLPTESVGKFLLPTIDRKQLKGREGMLGSLFQKAITGFYKNFWDKGNEISVSQGETIIEWDISSNSAGIKEILPKMKTDITMNKLDNLGTQTQRLIIDTKFSSILKSGQYRENTLASNHIYQIYAYLRSQEKPDDELSNASVGMLLHPTVDKEVDEYATIQGHPIWFCTVNLADETANIRQRLQDIVNQVFEEQPH